MAAYHIYVFVTIHIGFITRADYLKAYPDASWTHPPSSTGSGADGSATNGGASDDDHRLSFTDFLKMGVTNYVKSEFALPEEVKASDDTKGAAPSTSRVQSSFMAQLKAKTANVQQSQAVTPSETAAHAALTSPRPVAPTPRSHHKSRPSVVIVPYVNTSSPFHTNTLCRMH